MSLRERILQAETHEEIERLLSHGGEFQRAKARTQVQWARAAHQRREELKNGR